MKLSQFRRIIKEEVRRVLNENSLKLGNGKVVKNVVVDANGIKFGNKSVSFDDINYFLSTKPGKEQQLAKLVMDSELLQQLMIEVELNISDEEGVGDVISMDDPKLASQLKALTNFEYI